MEYGGWLKLYGYEVNIIGPIWHVYMSGLRKRLEIPIMIHRVMLRMTLMLGYLHC